MLKNLASLGGAGAVRKSLAFEARPKSSLLETLKASRTSHQLNIPTEFNSATVNNNFRPFRASNAKEYDTERHIRKFPFTGRYPTLSVSKNLSNPNISNHDHFEFKVERPLSCPQKPLPPSSSLRSSLAASHTKLHSDASQKRNASVPPQHLSPFLRVREVKSSRETARNVDQTKYSRESSTFGRNINSKLRTPTKTDEKETCKNISPNYNFRKRHFVPVTESKNTEDFKKALSTVENKAVDAKHNNYKAGNDDVSKLVNTEPECFDLNGCENAASSVSNNHNQRVNTNPHSSLSSRSYSSEILRKQNNSLRKSSHNANNSEENKISNERKFAKNLSQSLETLPNIQILNDPTSDKNAILNKPSPISKPSNKFQLSSPLTTSKSFMSHKGSSNKGKTTEKETSSPNKSSNYENIVCESVNTRKNNTVLNILGRSFGSEGNYKQVHSTLTKQISSLKNVNSKNKFEKGVLDRFKNRKISVNKINHTSLPRHDLLFRPFNSKKHSHKQNVNKRSFEPSPNEGSSLYNARVKSTSDMFKKPKVFYLGTNKAQPTDGQLSFIASQPSKSSSTSRGRNPILNKYSKLATSKRRDNTSENETKKGSGSSNGSERRDGNGHQKHGLPDTKIYSPFRSAESCLTGTHVVYLEQLHQVWKKNPQDVHPSWNNFFLSMAGEACPETTLTPVSQKRHISPEITRSAEGVSSSSAALHSSSDRLKIIQQVTLQNVLQYYQMFGHLHAEVDPLQRRGPALGTPFVKCTDKQRPTSVEKMLQEHRMADFNEHFFVPLNSSIAKPNETTLPLGEILNRLQDAYCQYIGIEYTHIASPAKQKWIRDRFEVGINSLTPVEKKKLWRRLMQSSYFEDFLTRKWPTSFRFSLEGCEILIPALQELIDRCAENGTQSIVLGMAHRGRLNVLANILNIEIEKLLLHFKPNVSFGKIVGDVKYHLGGYVTQKHEETNKDITICIVSNASHLESVNPIVQGRCKAEQTILNDHDGKKVVPILVHGDAAYAGQGCVYENNVLSSIPEYNVQGTIHIVVNNNIGFTTIPEESRSALYCTDVAKIAQAPVFHVNSEKPNDVLHCINVACAFRNQFQSDVVVDLVCYRRYGHNEADEPSYTSPTLYEQIRARKPWPETYTEQLLNEKVISQEDIEKEKSAYIKRCEDALKKSQTYNTIDWKDWNDSPWRGANIIKTEEKMEKLPLTGIPEETMKNIALKSMEIPEGFIIHKLLNRVFKSRKQMIEMRTADWALAEVLAYGSLLLEGVPIRFSGQDAQRGTFSHRHHVLHHQKKDDDLHVPLNHLSNKQGKYDILNTPLIEYGALAFETGFAMSFANALTIYEGQYGDFINNAQLIFDAYLSSGESKWGRQCGLVVLAPHGMEGMGSEHSSARLERYLQMSSEGTRAISYMNEPKFAFNQLKYTNWVVANCTTPANFFHIIRRQIKLPFRKPLIIMSPKSLLRHPEVKSSFDEMTESTSFKSVIPDTTIASKSPESVKKHIICSGRVYYDLMEARQKHNLQSSIAITRIEQLAPFPFDSVLKEIQKYRFAEVCWAQEEHKNQGAWNYVFERLSALLQDTDWYAVSFAGRKESPVTAVGSVNLHNNEKENFLENAMTVAADFKDRGTKIDKK